MKVRQSLEITDTDFAHLHIRLLLKLEAFLHNTRAVKFASKPVQSIWPTSRPTTSSNIAGELTISAHLSNHAISSKRFSSSVRGTDGIIWSITCPLIRCTREKSRTDIFLVFIMWLAKKALNVPRCIVFATHRQVEKLMAFSLENEIEHALKFENPKLQEFAIPAHESRRSNSVLGDPEEMWRYGSSTIRLTQ